MTRITNQIYSDVLRKRRSAEQASGVGSFQLEDCFTGNIGEQCKINWDDVDQFNEEKEKNREFSEIKINADQYRASFEKDSSMPDAKLHQLIELVPMVPLKGTPQNQEYVLGLVKQHKTLKYLNRVDRLSYALMAKNMLGNVYQSDIKGVAVDLGFIVADSGLAKAGEDALAKGTKLVLSGNRVFGQSLKLASPFLARGTSAFVIYDLYKKIKAYQKGNPDAKIEVIRDGTILGLDGLELGIELTELSGLLEGVSSFTGPIGAMIGVVIFIGTDIYLSVQRVNRVGALIHLTNTEKVVEGLKAFFEIELEPHIKTLLEEKQGNNALFSKQLPFLKNNPTIQRMVLPTLYKAGEVCESTFIEKMRYGGVGVGMYRKVVEEKKCAPKLEVNLDNTVLLDHKKNDIKWSGTKPDATGGGSLFCAPLGNDLEVPSDGAYFCDKAMGIEYADGRKGNVTFMQLGDGKDKVIGFPQSNHLVSLGNGNKDIRLGDGNDTLVLNGDKTSGILDGGKGINTLDLDYFAKNEKFISIQNPSDTTSEVPFSLRGEIVRFLFNDAFNEVDGLILLHINHFLLRTDKRDFISAACNTRYIDARGGEKRDGGHDSILIPNDGCPFVLNVMARPYTRIINQSNHKESKFNYIVPVSTEEGNKFTLVELKGSGGLHRFISDYSLSDIFNLQRKSSGKIEFAFLKDRKSLLLEITPPASATSENNLFFTLSDNITINMQGNRFYAFQNTTRPVSEIIDEYSKRAERLKLTMFVQSQLKNESIAIGHGSHEILHNDPYRRSHLVGNGGENVFVITSGHEVLYRNKLPNIPEIVLYDKDNENLIDTLDLRQLINQFAKDLRLEVKAKARVDRDDIVLELYSPNVGGKLASVRLNNALVTNWHKRLHILLNHAPMELDALELKPLPLEFGSHIDNIYISPENVEENTTLVIAKNSGNYRFIRYRDNLMISNAFDPNVAVDQCYTLSLQGFYKTRKLATLSIKFADKEIVLKDKAVDIARANKFSKYLERSSRMLRNKAFEKSPAEKSSVSVRGRRAHNEEWIEENAAHSIEKEEVKSIWKGMSSYVLAAIAGAGTLFGAGIGLRYHMRNRLHANAMPIAVVLPLLSANTVEAKSINNEVGLASLDKARVPLLGGDVGADGNVWRVDECEWGARDGDELVAGVTCHTKNAQAMIFLKDSDIKLEKPEGKFFKESCRPIEFNGRPSIHCEGEENNIVYTPEVFEPPLDRINSQLMLLQIGLHEGKKLYNWLQDSSSERTSALPQVVPITTEQKTTWIELLVDIEVRLDIEKRLGHMDNAGTAEDELRWVRHILEDRKEEYKYLSQKSQASLDDMTALTENLKALQAELEDMLDHPVLLSNSGARQSDEQSVRKESVSHDSSPWAANTALLSNSAKQEIRVKSGIRQRFFKEIPQAIPTSLPIHAMNSSMMNATSIQQQFIGMK